MNLHVTLNDRDFPRQRRQHTRRYTLAVAKDAKASGEFIEIQVKRGIGVSGHLTIPCDVAEWLANAILQGAGMNEFDSQLNVREELKYGDEVRQRSKYETLLDGQWVAYDSDPSEPSEHGKRETE